MKIELRTAILEFTKSQILSLGVNKMEVQNVIEKLKLQEIIILIVLGSELLIKQSTIAPIKEDY
jgi:hypothetical protein